MGSIPTTEVKVKVNPKVSYGLISIGGIVLALAQYITALGNALSAGEINSGSLGLITTATATFLAVAAGRYKQASDVIKGISAEKAANPAVVVNGEDGGPEANVLYLDGQQIANALVKALNTNALISQMAPKVPVPAPAPAPEPAAPTEV